MKKNGGQRRYLSGALGLAAALGIASIGVHCTGGGANPSNNPASTAPRGELPGSSPRSRELSDKLSAALTSKGAGYKPRTAHTKPDGSPKYTNRLILEASPYLLQHAHNPVDWYPWGDEAFAAARRENKPVFLSVGYSTCHWCHVMERESFENDEIAAFINEHYIAIKVDREERPDVDALYMAAVQALSGGGGWPMTVIMTPDREPFFAGTYFPAKDGDRGAKRGLSSILKELAERYLKERSELVERAGEVTKRLQMGMGGSPASGGAAPSLELVAQAAAQLGASFDSARGGFGGAPKFPRSANIELLLRHHRRTREPLALAMAVKTLDAMAAGGIFDHIGGGFHRYSTDAAWLIPHFEKMLYDNAQLAISYLEAYQATGSAAYAGVARRTLDYVLREMTSPEGGFFSATDADSEGEEGKFFVWTPAEIAAALGPERLSAARAASAYFGVTPKGNFEGKNILFTPRPMGDVARDLGLTEQALSAEIEAARALLYTARARRVPPLRDDKILTSWNGLMIAAMARGGFVLAEPRYLDAARRASERLFSRRATDGRLVRNAASASGGAAYLDDYAFFIAGLLELQRATGEVRWLSEAIKLQALLDAHYWDSAAGGYFTTADDAEKLFARDKPDYDGAEPSGSSVAIDNLCALAEITSNTRYVQAADRALAAFSAALRRAPRALPRMLTALDRCAGDPLEIAIVSPANPSGDKANLPVGPEALLAKLRAAFVPGHTLLVATEGKDLEEKAALAPLLEQKTAIKGITTAYVCRRGACKQPTSDPEVFAKKLAEDAQP